MQELVLDGAQIADFQSCQRKWLIGQDWRPGRWNPKVLFDACYRRAVLALSQGKKAEAVADEARGRFLESAASPGIVSYGNPYHEAVEWSLLLQNAILGSVGRIPPGMKEIPDQEDWRFLAWRDGEGILRRFVSASRVDAGFVEYLKHSWQTAGDMAMAGSGMKITVLLIGDAHHGIRQSLWTRAWVHPGVINGHYHFQTKSGKAPRNWKPFRLIEHPGVDGEDWVERMKAEGAMGKMFCEIEIAPMEGRERDQTLCDIDMTRLKMESIQASPMGFVPMSRNACDDIVPCWARGFCYAEQGEELKDVLVPIQTTRDTGVSSPSRRPEAQAPSAARSASTPA